jgi:hypothetical protein
MDHNFNVRQARSVGDVLGDTFTYIRVYYKSLAKMIAIYVLGPLMLGSVILAFGFGDIFGQSFLTPAEIEESVLFNSAGLLFGAFFFIGLSYVLLYGTICQHLKYAAEGDVPLDIATFSKGMFFKVLVLVFIFILLVVLFSVIFLLLPTLLFTLISSQLGVLTIAFVFLFSILISIFVFIRLMVFPVALFVKDTGGLNSLGVSWDLTKGYFWQTFGLYLLITIVFGILSQLISTPLLLINVIVGAGFGNAAGGLMEVISTIFFTASFVFQGLFFGAQTISIGLHYFNLEERKEGQALGEQIAGLEGDIA